VKTAIIDLGTNTFNLLIAEVNAKSFAVLYAAKEAVKIGEGGILNGVISDDAIERAMRALEGYTQTIASFNCEKVFAFGTSAMRDAKNGGELVVRIKERLGIDVQIISGLEEAQLIVEGVRLAVPMTAEPMLIMDIGGGSTEFIIANNETVFWKESYQLGVSRIRQLLQPEDPISPENLSSLDALLKSELEDMIVQCNALGVQSMVGSSGSFDSFIEMIWTEKGDSTDVKSVLTESFNLDALAALNSKLLAGTFAERKAIPGLVEMRVDTIHIASFMVQWVLRHCQLNEVVLSTYALKEGVLSRIMKGSSGI
jgi:exopolyphosphatase/guanosine-5'-triphosphate,3'-diphosphate pyrophosphatase